ncbi:bacterial Ig-like domain protein [Methanobrevibacter oralis]|uniref:Bacterial Ig-like domain protein n=1 Tax=Methanobrevibacter oralis TaxID=66851 RepID=A0A162FG12_METOA|nr:Ig-like domain-containing protein [Methanobrevibacter oralis]KZX12515.1 bacterial Ig-like domain protein [Methanobrevibacter oralis]
MKINKLILMVILIGAVLTLSTISASDLNCTNELNINDSGIQRNSLDVYLDNVNGHDSNDGKTNTSAVKTFNKALSLANDNSSIYIANGVYSGNKNTKITIGKSVNIIGSSDTIFDGLKVNYIFIVSNYAKVTFKNIKFINAYKIYSDSSQSGHCSMYGAALEIKNASVTLDNCSFMNNYLNYVSVVNFYNYGGAVSNLGNLTVLNSYFINNSVGTTSGLNGYGGSIYNKGNLSINNSSFLNSKSRDFSYGGAIANDGYAIVNNTLIKGLYVRHESRGSAIYNNGNFLLVNSIIENNTIERGNFNYIYGCIYNNKKFVAYGNIFRNNKGYYEKPHPSFKGSPTIFNVGSINLTYNAFINNAPFSGIASDLFYYGGEIISIDNNWWSTNKDPYLTNKINIKDNINSWLVFDLTPNYSALNISDHVDITAIWKLSSGLTPNIKLFPVLNVNFTTNVNNVVHKAYEKLDNGNSIFTFNFTDKKGGYFVIASIEGFSHNVMVDVGKGKSIIKFNVTDNIVYTENILIDVEVSDELSSLLNGNVSVYFNENKSNLNLTNGKTTFNFTNFPTGVHVFYIVYEGDENYFKAFKRVVVTINKAPTELSIHVPDFKIDKKVNLIVTLGPKGIRGIAYVYVDGIRKTIAYLYNGNTTIKLSNFAEGKHNLTIEYLGNENFEPCNASTTFKVTKYDTSLSVTSLDINSGQDAIISVTVNPSDLRGEAILSINGVNSTIFLKDTQTDIRVANLTKGVYNVVIFYKGDKKYYSSNASTSFTVLKALSNINVDIVKNNLTGNIIVTTNPINCTGVVGMFINFDEYRLNLTRGIANFSVEFYKGTNYIFVFYEGDNIYEGSSWNITIGEAEEFTFIGGNVIAYEHNDFNYKVRLVEDNGIPIQNKIVNFKLNNKLYNVTTNKDGFAYLPLNLNKGVYNIQATFKNKTISNTLNIKAIDFNLIISNSSYLENESFEVFFKYNITGNLKFIVENEFNATVDIDGIKAVFTTNKLNAGNYTVKVIYSNEFYTAPAKISNFEIKKANTNLIINISSGIENRMITVFFPETASGSVNITVDGINYICNINRAKAILNLFNLSKTNHQVVVNYGGDNNFNGANLTTSFIVKEFLSDLILTINNAIYGENITVTANLNKNTTGNIIFSVESLSKTVEIHNGQASWTFNWIDVGNHIIKAFYPGDELFISSTNSTSFNIAKANSTIVLYTKDVVLNENIRIYANLSKNATGSVAFSIVDYYSPRNKPISNSTAQWYISPLTTGQYKVIANYIGDNNYNPSYTIYLLNVTQKRAKLSVEVNDIAVNEVLVVKVKLTGPNNEGINGSVVLNLNSKSYTIHVKNGVGSLYVGKFAVGTYEYSVTYQGSANYSKTSVNKKFNVIDSLLNISLTAHDVTKFYKGSEKLKIILKYGNNGVSNAIIHITLNKKKYSVTTNSNGVAYLAIGLNPGKYKASISFDGNSKYNPAKSNAVINVLSTVEGMDLVKLYGTSSLYLSIFSDSNGKVLGNTKVKFTIGSKSFTATTLPNGVARLNINFKPGTYTITAINPVTGQKATNTIKIFYRIDQNKDLNMNFGSGKSYKVRLHNDDASVSGAGKIVVFKINNKVYKVKTDKKGHAYIKINLNPKIYFITATYKGFTVKNKIIVKPLLKAKNIIQKKSKITKFKVKLVNSNGKIQKSKKITFKIKGKTYKAKTNSKGAATLVLKNLKVGKHIIYSVYGKSKIKNSIKIIK